MKLSDIKTSDYPQYYKQYLDHLSNKNLYELLESQKEDFINFSKGLRQEDLNISYDEGKWTVAEVLQHIIDTERIFQYRALRIARKDKTPLPGFDQDAYVPVSLSNRRSVNELSDDFVAVRNSTIILFKSFTQEMLLEKGISSGGDLSVAAAGFIICGHQKHHQILFQSKYGL